MRVLVVEDNPDLGTNLQKGLREHGYAVDLARDFTSGCRLALAGHYDLLILDRMLPGGDGLDLLRTLRAQNVAIPAIFLTARGDVEERIRGLRAGADDYLAKPFSFAELLARMQVVLRRGPDSASRVLKVADLQLDPLTHAVERAGQEIELTAKQFTLLHYLMSQAGRVVTRSMLLEHVWNFEFDGASNVIDVHINRLRKKIDRDFEKPLIRTLRGVGYVLRDE
jgi:two-component system OmpR family response regulator